MIAWPFARRRSAQPPAVHDHSDRLAADADHGYRTSGAGEIGHLAFELAVALKV